MPRVFSAAASASRTPDAAVGLGISRARPLRTPDVPSAADLLRLIGCGNQTKVKSFWRPSVARRSACRGSPPSLRRQPVSILRCESQLPTTARLVDAGSCLRKPTSRPIRAPSIIDLPDGVRLVSCPTSRPLSNESHETPRTHSRNLASADVIHHDSSPLGTLARPLLMRLAARLDPRARCWSTDVCNQLSVRALLHL